MHSYLSRYKWFLVWAEVQRPSPRQNKCMDREVFLFVFRWLFFFFGKIFEQDNNLHYNLHFLMTANPLTVRGVDMLIVIS